jgi:hypothetical protein
MSLIKTGPDVDPNLFLRVDIEAYSDAWQEITAAHEPQCRSWAFNATFDVLHHPALVDDHVEISEDYVQGTLNHQTVVKRLELFSFAMPQNRSSMSNHCAVPVTGVLRSKTPLRLRTVRTIFQKIPGHNTRHIPGLTVDPKSGNFVCISCLVQGFMQFLDRSTKDRSARRIRIYCFVLMSDNAVTRPNQRRKARKDPESRRSHFTAAWRLPRRWQRLGPQLRRSLRLARRRRRLARRRRRLARRQRLPRRWRRLARRRRRLPGWPAAGACRGAGDAWPAYPPY